ncbi:FMN-binding protein [bacterium]|nr:FMN-binding protein [bacterium]
MNAPTRMIVVLGSITLISGLSLGALNEATYELAANNVLRFKKIPAVVEIYRAMGQEVDAARRSVLEEELLTEKRLVDVGGTDPLLVFVVKDGEKPVAVALEGTGQGFGGDVGVMVGVDLATTDLAGVGITTMSETPGVGTRAREASFTSQFTGLPGDTVFRVKKDGGTIDSITGATVTSRAVVAGVEGAVETFRAHEDAIRDAVAAGPALSAATQPGGVS